MNAVGDHYLQDFFAPGHITTRRYKIADLFTNSLHDAVHNAGATLHASKGNDFQALKDTIHQIRKLLSERDPGNQDAKSIESYQMICNFLLGEGQYEKGVCTLPDSASGFESVTSREIIFL